MKTGKLHGRVAVITGASKGIGAGIAKRFAAEGASAVVNHSSAKQDADHVVDAIAKRGGQAIAGPGSDRVPMKILTNISRLLLALMFAVLGLNGFLQFILGAMSVSNYRLVIFALQLISDVLLLINRYVPLALTILSPIMMNILLYGMLINPAGSGFAFFIAILWAVVLVSVRSAFAGILEARVETQPVRSRARGARVASAA